MSAVWLVVAALGGYAAGWWICWRLWARPAIREADSLWKMLNREDEDEYA